MPALNLIPVDLETPPQNVAATLADVRARYGFVPNLYRYFAHAPGALNGYNGSTQRGNDEHSGAPKTGGGCRRCAPAGQTGA